ncbi:MAG: ABC transporter ATP-binding protein [Alcaligenaceae bacterium]|nr:ABC transporter ATP-binding protein [Alcaligenaceae bacterium]
MKQNFQQLRLDSVGRSFPTASGRPMVALRDLDLTIQRGEFVALLGPSGCGKSTALNCISGLMALTSGGIWLDDTRIDVLPSERRGFGMVFQNYALFPHMSVLANVGFGLRMRGMPKAEIVKRSRSALELVQLVGQENKLPGQLSGGQQQRVAIARAIVIEPPIILMDEPLSNLDAKLRIEMRAEIRRIHTQLDRATIYVTHDQDEALSMADKIVVMRDGVVQQVGAPREVYGRPANLHVARFMGYRNVLPFDLLARTDDRVSLGRDGVKLDGVVVGELSGAVRVSAAMRPEDFSVVSESGPNTIEATIDSMEFGGHSSLLRASTVVGEIYARVTDVVSVGDRVHLHIPAERVLTYPGEQA